VSKAVRWLVVVSCCCLATAFAFAAWLYIKKPTVLTVAVGPAEFDDADLMAALSHRLVASGSSIRISILSTSGPVEAVDRIGKGEAQLAVVRADAASAHGFQAVAILHTDPVVIVAPDKQKIDSFGDLKGKALGVIGPPGANDTLIATLRRHYGVSGSTVPLRATPAEIANAVRNKAVDALLFVVPTTRGAKVGDAWAGVRRASARKLSFVPLDESAGLAAANPAYDAGEIAAGQFGGSPALPDESVSTIMVGTYLVANRNVSASAITSLTREIFDQKQAMSAEAPLASLMKAASTDKDAVFSVHPGAKVYYDGEEKTLVEQYGDWVWYGPMIFGAVGSGLLFVMRFLGLREDGGDGRILFATREVIASIDAARTPDDLRAARVRIGAAVEALADQATRGELDGDRAAVAAMVVSYLDHLIDERRAALNGAANTSTLT
jgi:TRAP transporter TAXI family solute receptor